MNADQRWRDLGWRHPLWDILRFFLSLRHGSAERADWLERLKQTNTLSVEDSKSFPIDPADVKIFEEYITARAMHFATAFSSLRDEVDALKFCKRKAILVKKTTTKNQDHHQSSKAIIATVNAISERVCQQKKVGINPNPQRRCVWCVEKGLHVSVRNIDGAIPSLANPSIIWEIKEYWGLTKGGSKMSDAVYECNLVGRELREYEERSGVQVTHVVFLDGKTQWTARQSDLYRFIDLMNQGLIDYLFVGKEIETDWEPLLTKLLERK